MESGSKSLSGEVTRATGQNPFKCYQCGKCTAGCPMAGKGDLQAHQVFRLLQLGDDEVLRALQPWLCVSCQTCMTRCPQQLDLSKVMDFLRAEALRRGVAPAAARDLVAFNQVFLERVASSGRLNEAELGGFYNLRVRAPFKNLAAVPGLLTRGKIRLGHRVRGIREALQQAKKRPAV